MSKHSYTRRSFIGKCLGISAAGMGGLILSGCHNTESGQQEQKPASGPANCDDLTGVSEAELEKRKKFGYVQESTVPGSHCENCSLYVPPGQGDGCGGCLLFKGPVRPTGYCTQYAAKV